VRTKYIFFHVENHDCKKFVDLVTCTGHMGFTNMHVKLSCRNSLKWSRAIQNSLQSDILGINKNHLGGGTVIRAWDQEVCSFCGLRFESCGCSYDGHWRLTWSLTSGPVGLVEVRASWPGHPR